MRSQQLKIPQVYAYEGRSIADIAAWCRERGEQMVVVEFSRRDLNIFSRKMSEHREVREMPESFWASLRVNVTTEGVPREIRRYTP